MLHTAKNATRIHHIRGDVEDLNVPFFVNVVGETVQSKKFENGFARGRNDYYLMCMTSGALDARIGGERLLLEAGKFIIIPPHTPIFYNNYESEDPIRYYTMHFSGYDFESTVNRLGIEVGVLTSVKLTSELSYQFESILPVFSSLKNDMLIMLEIMVKAFLVELSRSISADDGTVEAHLERSIDYIRSHIHEQLSVHHLAQMEFFSPSRYRALFKAMTGYSPIEFITEQRITQACHLLEHGELSLSQVAEACGYGDRLYFQRIFKQRIGVPPGEYRARFQ